MIKRTIVIESTASLKLRQNQLVISRHDGPVKETSVPIEDIGVLVLESEHLTLTNALLSFLIEHQVAVISCNEKHMPVGLWLPLDGHSLQSARFQVQLESSLPLKKNIWAQLVEMKIENQGLVLEYFSKEAAPMFRWAKEVKSGDSTNLEARAAANYWSTLFEGTEFRRDRFGPPPNHLFNYGYAILRAVVARALVSSGLLPTFGVHHKNQYNAYCLADDVMEPFRPIVDRYILEQATELEVGEELMREWKLILLKIPTLDVLLGKEKRPLLVAATHVSASLVRLYEGKEKKLVLPTFPKYVVRSN